MSDSQFDPLSVVDALVSRFRNDWRSGKRPQIEAYVEGNSDIDGRELFRAFLAAELHERRSHGEHPSAEEYRDRFRQFSDIVAEEFADTQRSMADSSWRERVRPQAGGGEGADLLNGRDAESFGDRYQILDRLGAGAFGTVYKARDTKLDRLVALKTPRLGALGSEADAQRFLREARAAGQLRHPNIVPVYDAGEIGESYFIASSLIEGRTLADRLAKEKSVPAREAAVLIQKLAMALHYAHMNGIFHRDVKPANVMIDTTGEPLVMDFGMARRDEGEELRTQSGMLIGTPAYMSPEQHAGQSHLADARSDQWALGVMLYEMLTGHRPFQPTSDATIDDAVRNREPEDPRKSDRGISRDLATICLKCIRKEPEKRYASCEELGEDLGRWLGGVPITARPVRRIERVWSWCRRNPVVAGLSVGTAVLLLALATTACVGYLWVGRARVGEAQAESRSEAERRKGKVAAARADEAKKLAEMKAREAKKNLYFRSIVSARTKWLAGEVKAAEEDLGLCPPELRNWEWGYLKRLCRLDEGTIQVASESVTHAALSPDGERVAVATENRHKYRIVVHNVATGERIMDAKQETSVVGLAFSQDSKQVATARWEGTIKVYELESGKARATLKAGEKSTSKMVFTPNSTRLVVGGSRSVRFYDLATGDVVHTLDTSGSSGVAFSADGKWLATVSLATVTIWDVGSWGLSRTMSGRGDIIRCIAFSPDGKYVAAGNGKLDALGSHAKGQSVIQVWETASGNEIVTLPGHSPEVTMISFCGDGRRLVSAGADRTVRVWDVTLGRELTAFRGHNGVVLDVRLSGNGNRIVSVSEDRTVKTWDTAGREARQLFEKAPVVRNVVFSPDGKRVAVSTFEWIRICDAETGQRETSIPVRVTERTGLAFSPDGKRIASGDNKGTVSWDAVTGRERHMYPDGQGVPTALAYSPDGKFLAAGLNGKVVLWDTETRKEVRSIGRGSRVWSLAFSRDSKRVVVAVDGRMKIMEVATEEQEASSPRRRAWCTDVAFSPDGMQIGAAVGSVVQIFDSKDWEPKLQLRGHEKEVTCFAFSRDGKRIISGSLDGSIRVWDAIGGNEMLKLEHGRYVKCVAFSPDGKRIASAGLGDGMKVWEAVDWKAP